MTGSFTRSSSFTITHARYLASKVAADMHLCAHYYGNPCEAWIRSYAEELAQYLNAGYLEEYEFGYKKNGVRVVTWRYKVTSTVPSRLMIGPARSQLTLTSPAPLSSII